MRKTVSVIVPIYNVEKYLEECLNSIAKQTYRNIQVILVNDGSTDDSANICKEYIAQYNWAYVEQKNQGLSAARNAGISIANGEYICFIDSDDWIAEDMIERLLEAAEEYQADIVECGRCDVYLDETKTIAEKETLVLDKHQALEGYLLQTKTIHSTVIAKIYKKHIFKHLMFEVGRLHEDGFFTYRAMYFSERYVLSDYAGYYYRKDRPGSIMTVQVKPKNIIDVTDMMEERICFFQEKGESALAEMAEAYHYRTMLTNYSTCKNKLGDKELTDKIKKKLTDVKSKVLANKYLKVKKLKFLVFYYFHWIFNLLYRN